MRKYHIFGLMLTQLNWRIDFLAIMLQHWNK